MLIGAQTCPTFLWGLVQNEAMSTGSLGRPATYWVARIFVDRAFKTSQKESESAPVMIVVSVGV